MSCLTPEEFETIRRHPLLRTRAEFAMIVRTVCAEFGVDPALIYTPNRGEALTCEARNMICLIANQRGFSKMEIGRLIGRDVMTVRHAIKNVPSSEGLMFRSCR